MIGKRKKKRERFEKKQKEKLCWEKFKDKVK